MKLQDYTVPDFLGRDTKEIAVSKVQTVLDNMKNRGIVYVDGRDCITGYSYHELYDWDLYFETLFLSYFGVSKFCRSNVELFLDTQHPSGFVSRAFVTPRMRQHFKPFLAQTALLGAEQTKDFRWMAGNVYDRLGKYIDYWFRYCDTDRNGLVFWDSADASGMDNQVRRLGPLNQMEFEGVDLNCYIVREMDAMSRIAKNLGRLEDEKRWTERADELRRRINEVFWDEEDGFYYDRSETTGRLNKVKSVAGFMPMWVGAAPKDRAERLVREHLTNPDEFWLKYPVATWSKSEPDYYQERHVGECSWMGATWIPTNYMVFRGLVNMGFTEEARALAQKTFELVVSEADLREYYNGETGSGQGLAPFWGWSSLGYVMLAELETGKSNSDQSGEISVFEGFRF